jgi:hypothetical protein
MYAIVTMYVGPTNFRGSRVVATAGQPARRIVVPYSGYSSDDAAHAAAREAWLEKYANPTSPYRREGIRWAMGTLPNGATVHTPYFVD